MIFSWKTVTQGLLAAYPWVLFAGQKQLVEGLTAAQSTGNPTFSLARPRFVVD